jgi:hypothetical protein
MLGCCAHRPLEVDPDLDLPVPLAVVLDALRSMLADATPMQLQPAGSEAPWPLRDAELGALLGPEVSAWVVQRPRCGGGWSTRAILTTDDQVLAAIVPERIGHDPEPPSWRLHLLLGMARAA